MRGRDALLIVAVGVAAYSNSFRVPFQFDDAVVILGEPAVTRFEPSPASRRFLGDLSFAVSYRLFGAHPGGYHATNLAIHVANALLVYWLVLLLSRTAPMHGTPPAGSRAAALVGALVFVAHPLQTQAVTYLAQRYAALAATFFLLAVCSYVRFRLSDRRSRSIAWYVLFVSSSAAAFWTKENTLVLPLAVALVEYTFFEAPPSRRALFLAPFLAGAVGAAVVALVVGVTPAQIDAATRVDTSMPRSDYALTQIRVVATYLRMLVWPAGQSLDHDITVSRSVADLRVLAAACVHVLFLAGAGLALRASRRSEPSYRFVWFGVVWFYVTMLVESSFVPIVDVMYEHRAYLPSVGPFVAFGTLASVVLRPFHPRVRIVAVAVPIVVVAGLTFARNRVWQNELSLWSDAASKAPNKARPANNVGTALLRQGDSAGAVAAFRRAIQNDPSYLKAYFNLAEVLKDLDRCAEAIPAYWTFMRAFPAYPETYRSLADCYERTGDSALAAQFRALHERIAAEARGKPLDTYFR